MRMIDCSQNEIKGSLIKLESKIRTKLLPKLTGRVSPRDIERHRDICARASSKTGWFIKPETNAAQKLKESERICKPLVGKLLSGDTDLHGIASRQKRASSEI